MSQSNSKKFAQHLWNAQENPCIWMEAGLVQYKLCDRGYDCENCPFDACIRSGGLVDTVKKTCDNQRPSATLMDMPTQASTDIVSPKLSRVYYDPDAYYGAHFWEARKTSERRIRLTLSDLGLKLLPRIKEVVFPPQETSIRKGQTVSWLICSKGTLCLKSPFEGEILANNKDFFVNSQTGTDFGPSYLLEMGAEHIAEQLDAFKSGDEVVPFLQAQRTRIAEKFESALFGYRRVLGETLQDGGERISDVEIMLGQEKYLALVSELYQIC